MKVARTMVILVLIISIFAIVSIYITAFRESPPLTSTPMASVYPATLETNSSMRFTINAISASIPLSDLRGALQIDQGGYGPPAYLGGGVRQDIRAGSGELLHADVVDHNSNSRLDAGDGLIILSEDGPLPSGEYHLMLIHGPTGNTICMSTVLVP